MRVVLTKKLAEMLDGIDLSRYSVGDIVEVTRAEAELLIAEGWAKPVVERPKLVRKPTSTVPTVPANNTNVVLRSAERLREIRRAMEQRSSEEHENRHAEDRYREELREARAKTVGKRGA